jgi:hypothetical protein
MVWKVDHGVSKVGFWEEEETWGRSPYLTSFKKNYKKSRGEAGEILQSRIVVLCRG